jgi:hypothetical protein
MRRRTTSLVSEVLGKSLRIDVHDGKPHRFGNFTNRWAARRLFISAVSHRSCRSLFCPRTPRTANDPPQGGSLRSTNVNQDGANAVPYGFRDLIKCQPRSGFVQSLVLSIASCGHSRLAGPHQTSIRTACLPGRADRRQTRRE